MLFALIVLIGFGGLFIMATDDSGSYRGENIHTRIKSSKSAINDKKRAIIYWKEAAVTYDLRRQQLVDLDGVKSKVKNAISEVSRYETLVEAAKSEIVNLDQRAEDYKKEYRVSERERAIGEEVASMSTVDGKVYEKVSIRKVTALGMEIRHQNGFKRIHYQNLPDEMQDRFQFTETDAKALVETEKVAVKNADRGKANYHKSAKELRKRELTRNHHADVARWKGEIAKLEMKIRSNSTAIKSAHARAKQYRARGNSGLNYDTARKAEDKADRLARSSSKARASISSLRRKINQPVSF